jgi:ribosomal protein S18 acetylase RimI-like enzyme
MAIHYEHLSEDDFPEAHATMVAAFADYQLDMSYMTPERSWQRNLKSGVRYDHSVGAYDGETMVGFTFVGLDDWLGELAAFDAGTGIIPAYRGQAIAKGMFEHILPRLGARGVSRFLLEVLQPNKAAIRAYEKSGFSITREFACFDLYPDSFAKPGLSVSSIEVRVVDDSTVQSFSSEVDWQPSWENSFSGMHRIRDDLIMLGAFDGVRCIGMLVYYPLLQWIMCLIVDRGFRRQGVASALLQALMADLWLPEGVDCVKINNLDRSDTATLAFFERAGAQWVIDQYEMECRF